MNKPDSVDHPTPTEKVMPQFSKTAAETRGEEQDEGSGPVDGPAVARDPKVSPGDAPVGRSDSDGSSPYEEPNQPAKKQRSN